ncbi:hypothetical protein BC835DRAFT_1404375 [Cytidiella melzeri]|nr:hypothetical protein BC835DRAFT_1404375 [Cytidiella melzeri]
MACLNKLAIRGIRSFDDKQLAVIEFFTPVTVIVGHNGSGKTTIIECLKYAATGDHPPNSRGVAFVHDPKMANEKEVKAQVRLRFVAANGQRMFVMRNLSVKMKKTGGMGLETLEGVLGVSDNTDRGNKRGTISTKCAAMNLEIPQLFGVSKAVLENVIFCHQEESYWPLSEPALLKKKFDDIFEATKYTKALDNIKTLRKDRVAELKAEKERLSSLSLEKAHADKLRTRMSDMTSNIAAKEIERDQLTERYNIVVAANAKFLETATKFRETFVKVEALEEKKKRYQEELDSARENFQEIAGTDEELANRLKNYNDHISERKRTRVKFDSKRQDLEEEIATQRAAHMKKVSEHGQLAAEAKAHEEVLREREEAIRELSTKHQLMGYDYSPLEREKIIEFITRLTDLQRAQNNETDALQSEQKSKSETYNAQLRRLHAEVERFKQQKDNLRERQATLQRGVVKADREVDAAEALTSKQKNIETDIAEKERRIQLVKDEIKAAKIEENLGEKAVKARALEAKVAELSGEIQSLNTQGSTRTRLDISRSNLTKTETEVRNLVEINNATFRALVGSDARPETMERELNRVAQEKERELADCEDSADRASRNLQAVEASISELKNQLRKKSEDVRSYDITIKRGLEETGTGAVTAHGAITEAEEEVNVRKEEIDQNTGSSKVYQGFLKIGKTQKRCPLCARDMNTDVMTTFEKNVHEGIQKSSAESIRTANEELDEWQTELKRLKQLGEIASARETITSKDIPGLQAQLKEKEKQLPDVTAKATETSKSVASLRQDISKISSLQEIARLVSREHGSLQQLKTDISNLEASLISTGSTKTVEEVQGEVDDIKAEQKTLERERQTLMAEKDRLQTNLRGFENDLHALQLNLSEVKNQLSHKMQAEQRIGEMKQELTDISATLKDLGTKIAEADVPIQRLEQEHSQADRELTAKIAKAQRASQELNMSVDKLESLNKTIERQVYVRGKRARLLSECAQKIEELDSEIMELNGKVEETRVEISGIDREISEGGAFVGNLRENMRVRKLIKDIAATQAEIATYDLDEAAKAKRIFDEKYAVEKQKETDLHAECSHVDGELSSLRVQLKTIEADFKEFKDISKRYRDQLIKVKLSDMANNDLEKYAKALDNAIMKYHSLKMEEVNDTMRHLWNKTYQGTDIDGIKIGSDSEGGATKRSYNYRVVMTKDNVEMDMRGRCSAGQKMLASIIIRLALADSFGQNCGILALDEPTNALDLENIDALAASLIDIINERKGHNFQLIVITHDENFLRKLGQSEVMEYYWRVSRDSRQKSVVERHRFG